MRTLILLSIVAVAFAEQPVCGENQRYKECGTACPLTCENYANPPKICVFMCVSGCHCEDGYVKTNDGRCVRPENCPGNAPFPVCGENQRYKECGTACPLTCQNYANPPRMCPAMCVSGCHCEVGYVKTKDGRCVRPENCPSDAPLPTETTCTDEPESGRCMAYFPSWFYNHKRGVCSRFVYGGCGGNGNRYESSEECIAKCEGVCAENQKFSNCGNACPRTCRNKDDLPRPCPAVCVRGCHCESGYVKADDGSCVLPEECPKTASGVQQKTNAEACILPAETGVCRGFFPRFYFDRTTGACQKFVYGGCGGNENNFESIEECHASCASRAAPEACLQEKVVGPCRAAFQRYFFNPETGKCEKFIYGGCQGNSNNFQSEEDCHALCAANRAAPTACLQEKVVGSCKAHFPRYFFNKETGKCEEFIYGGCDGNSNNFNTKEGCEAVCAA